MAFYFGLLGVPGMGYFRVLWPLILGYLAFQVGTVLLESPSAVKIYRAPWFIHCNRPRRSPSFKAKYQFQWKNFLALLGHRRPIGGPVRDVARKLWGGRPPRSYISLPGLS